MFLYIPSCNYLAVINILYIVFLYLIKCQRSNDDDDSAYYLSVFLFPSGDALQCFTCMGSNNEDCNRQGSKSCPSYSDACAAVVGHDSESNSDSVVAFLLLALFLPFFYQYERFIQLCFCLCVCVCMCVWIHHVYAGERAGVQKGSE